VANGQRTSSHAGQRRQFGCQWLVKLVSGMITSYCLDNKNYFAWVTVIISFITYYTCTMTTEIINIFISTMRRQNITSPCKLNKIPRRNRTGSCQRLYIRQKHSTRIVIKKYKKWKSKDSILQKRNTLQRGTIEHCVGCPAQENGRNGGMSMDSDCYQIAINSCCSYSIARNRRNITGQLTPCNIKIQGLAGGCAVKWKGTRKFEIDVA